MFIKITYSPERFANTDNIELISFGRLTGRQLTHTTACILEFRSGRTLEVSEQAGRALLEFTEANQSLIEDNDIIAPGVRAIDHTNSAVSASPLTSRIAQHLRDSALNGLSFIDLTLLFNITEEALLNEAIATLTQEKVIAFFPGISRYYHVSNAPGKADAEAF